MTQGSPDLLAGLRRKVGEEKGDGRKTEMREREAKGRQGKRKRRGGKVMGKDKGGRFVPPFRFSGYVHVCVSVKNIPGPPPHRPRLWSAKSADRPDSGVSC